MAQGGFDFTIKIGVDRNDVNTAIQNIDKAFTKSRTLNINTQAMVNQITNALNSIRIDTSRWFTNLPNNNNNNNNGGRNGTSNALTRALYTESSRANNNANLNILNNNQSSKTAEYLRRLQAIQSLERQLTRNQSRFDTRWGNSTNITADSQTYRSYLKRSKQLQKEINNLMKGMNSDQYDLINKSGEFFADQNLSSVTDATAKMEAFKDAIEKIHGKGNVTFGDFGKAFNTISYSVQDANGNTIKYISTIDTVNQGFRQLAVGAEGAGSQVEGMASGFDAVISKYLSNILTFQKALETLKKGMSFVQEFDDGLTSISLTMDLTASQLDDLGSDVIDNAKEMGTSISQALDVSKIYANMQSSTEEIIELTAPTIMLSNASGLDTATTSNYIQSVMQQFEMTSDQAEHIADVYESISANIRMDFAEGIGAIAEGVQVAGNLVNESGMSFEKFAAIVAKTAETTRQSGSTIGNAWKTILSRISKASNVSDDIDPETLSQVSESLSKIGIEVYNSEGEFRNVDLILTELASKYDSLSDAMQSEISYNIAATRNRNVLAVALKNYTEITELATEATNADGLAQETQAKYMESYTAKLNVAKDHIQDLYQTFLDNDLTNGAIDAFNAILNVINEILDATGSFGEIAAIFLSGKGISKLADIFDVKSVKNLKEALSDLSWPKSRHTFIELRIA